MSYFYSPSLQGWYDTNFAEYNLPSDAIELSEGQWISLRERLNSGEFLNADLVWTVVAEPLSSKISNERKWRNLELIRSDIELNRVQDADSKALGSVDDWRTYRKLLRAWPQHEKFPNKEFRPVSPK